MKKKLVILLTICTLGISAVACGNSENESNPQKESIENMDSGEDTKEDTKKEEATSKRDLPEGDYSDMGSGSFSIQTPSGDSSDGSTPILFVSKDDILIQIGYLAEGMDGSHLSYIYIDGMEVSKEQLGEMSQGTIALKENDLKEGVHDVEVVQYSTDNSDGEITTYKACQYEIKMQ